MAIQLHGGIGYTWEHDLHLAAKRATVLALQLGSRELHLSRVLEMEDA
jgi:alkylation response protein AidB-like acyl-CoA dehydrogenase